MLVNKFSADPELKSQGPNLILEQLPQGLDQFEFQVRRQPPDIVVGFNRLGRALTEVLSITSG